MVAEEKYLVFRGYLEKGNCSGYSLKQSQSQASRRMITAQASTAATALLYEQFKSRIHNF